MGKLIAYIFLSKQDRYNKKLLNNSWIFISTAIQYKVRDQRSTFSLLICNSNKYTKEGNISAFYILVPVDLYS